MVDLIMWSVLALGAAALIIPVVIGVRRERAKSPEQKRLEAQAEQEARRKERKVWDIVLGGVAACFALLYFSESRVDADYRCRMEAASYTPSSDNRGTYYSGCIGRHQNGWLPQARRSVFGTN